MATPLAWWRKLGTALAALVLAVIVFGPSLDGLVCGDEAGMAAAASESAGAVATPAHDVTGENEDGFCVCLHGHCHHNASSISMAALDSIPPDDPDVDAYALVSGRVATSDPKFDLMRPPRG